MAAPERLAPQQSRPQRLIPLIISTAAAAGQRQDASAPVMTEAAEAMGFYAGDPVIVADGEAVGDALQELIEHQKPAAIITTGGTGLTPDDHTPEETLKVIDRQIPGIAEALRARGRENTPLADLSRGIVGVAGSTVIVNLPGSPKAVAEGMDVLSGVLPHLCDQVANLRTHHEGGAVGDAATSVVVHTAITDQLLDPSVAEQQAWSAEAGAVVVFSGIVRNHDGGKDVERLNYTAHPLAESILTETAGGVAAQHPGVRLVAEHRIGDLGIGDHALIAAAAAAHRAEAIAACSALVEEIKAQVPIWKEQYFTDGTREWVGI